MPEHGLETRDHGSGCTGLVQGGRGSWKGQSSKGITSSKVSVPLRGSCMCAQSRLTCCNLMDCSPPGCSVHGILQVRLWIGLPFPSPEDLPNPGMETMSLASSPLASRFFYHCPPGKPSITLTGLSINLISIGLFIYKWMLLFSC